MSIGNSASAALLHAYTVFLVAFIDELPRNATGKVVTRYLTGRV